MCADETLVGVGVPKTLKDPWQEGYNQQKSWHEFDKPKDCTDFLKVCASDSQRLVLTKQGNLFCQGENLRVYIDPEVDANVPTKDFIEVTDVFPVEDQIVDVAAGLFNTIVSTQ